MLRNLLKSKTRHKQKQTVISDNNIHYTIKSDYRLTLEKLTKYDGYLNTVFN
jgi:hypothetical protein